MTSLAAEVNRLCVFIAPITAECARRNKHKGNQEKSKERAPRMRIVQIESGISEDPGWRSAPTAATLDQHTEHHDEHPEHQDGRKDYVGENAEIWILGIGSNLDQKQQNDADQTRDDDRRAHKADVIAENTGRMGSKLFDLTHAECQNP